MTHCSHKRCISFPLSFNENADSHTLLDIKNILIFCTIGRPFLFPAITMQIKYINLIEALHKTLTHSPEGRIIEITVVGNKGMNAITCPLNTPLCEADKFDIVILQPFRVTLT